MWKIILCELLMLILHSWDKIQLVHDVSACFILLDLVCEYFRTSKPMFVSLISLFCTSVGFTTKTKPAP